MLVLLCAAPPVLAALAAGVLMGLLQRSTQVRERAIATVSKMPPRWWRWRSAGPWIGAQLVAFLRAVLEAGAGARPHVKRVAR